MTQRIVYAGVLALLLAGPQLTVGGEDPVFGDLYGEGDSRDFVKGESWKEQGLTLPAYPDTSSRKLIEVDLLLSRFPFRLFIDPDSVSVGEDRVVRYTAILKSRSGATSVFYEGIRCTRDQYRRYAYGGEDGFRLSSNSRWRYIGVNGANRYLKVLHSHFMCPSPPPGKPGAVLARLRRPNPDNFLFEEDE